MKLNVRPHAGPPLFLLVSIYLGLFVAGLAVSAALRHGPGYVNQFETADRVRTFFAQTPQATRSSGFFIFGSAIPLGLLTATIVSRLRFLGVKAAGTYIALFGGFFASGALAFCGLLTWTLSLPEVSASTSTVRAVHFLSFLSGGAAFAVGFGLLAAGVSVTSGFTRLLPRSVVAFGLLIAVAGEFSSLSLLTSALNVLLPIARFGGMLWLLMVAIILPSTRIADDRNRALEG